LEIGNRRNINKAIKVKTVKGGMMAKAKNSIDFILEASMDPVLGNEFLNTDTVDSLKALYNKAGIPVPDDAECQKILDAKKNLADNIGLKSPIDGVKY
jgi:hypothetical protein